MGRMILLLSLFGAALGIGSDLVKLDIQGIHNGAAYSAGNWGAISMSTDGTKAIGTSSSFIWTSTNGGTNWTESSVGATDVLVTPDGSKMMALTTRSVNGRNRRVSAFRSHLD